MRPAGVPGIEGIMTQSELLADFSVGEKLSSPARETLAIRVLEPLGCAIGALGGEPVHFVRRQVEEFGGAPLCTMIGGGRTGARPGNVLQRRAGAVSRLQRQLPGKG